jgi:hypothetical protein
MESQMSTTPAINATGNNDTGENLKWPQRDTQRPGTDGFMKNPIVENLLFFSFI